MYLDFLSISSTLISLQSKWFHIDLPFSHNNNHIISTILKLIGAYVIMVPWFPFNSTLISPKMITYEPITQSSHITHQFNHTTYRLCILWQPGSRRIDQKINFLIFRLRIGVATIVYYRKRFYEPSLGFKSQLRVWKVLTPHNVSF